MRLLYADVEVRLGLSAEAAAEQCLFAPVSVYRQASAVGQLDGCPYARKSLFVLSIGEASQHADGRSLILWTTAGAGAQPTFGFPLCCKVFWKRACVSAGPIEAKVQL